jgi:hypothetical protein
MLDELTRSLFFVVCGSIAACSWFAGAYSVYRGLQTLPDGQSDVPFFSHDPRLISEEGKLWRRRIYFCAAYFALSLVIALLVRQP